MEVQKRVSLLFMVFFLDNKSLSEFYPDMVLRKQNDW